MNQWTPKVVVLALDVELVVGYKKNNIKMCEILPSVDLVEWWQQAPFASVFVIWQVFVVWPLFSPQKTQYNFLGCELSLPLKL